MNHHTRSYSEQPQIAPRLNAVGATNGQPNNGLAQPQSFIRIHSDSQQSLDQLFNPTLTSSVPLRNRNLPSSFFNPTVKSENGTNGTGMADVNHAQGNNLHNRSISFDQRNPNGPTQPHRQNFHMRTHSTLAPMPRLDSNHSSHQSSHEFLNMTTPNAPNNSNNNNNNNNNNNVSSCQQHSENIVSSTSTNNHNHNHHHHHHHHQQQQQQRHLHHHSHSNGWSSAGNSIDDLSMSNWVAGQPQSPTVAHQPMQVVQHHQPTIMHEHAVQIQPSQQTQHQHHTATSVVASNNVDQPMFYNAAQQTVAAADTTTTPMIATNHVCPNHSLHNRSVSYHQRPAVVASDMRPNHGFHMRTHSTVAPMSSTCHHHHQQQATSQHSSNRTSQELLNHSSSTNSSAAAGWCSSGYSTDDMTSAGAGNAWMPAHHQHQHPPQSQLHITQQPLPQPPTMDHQPSAAPMAALPLGHSNHHIPLQAQQQTAHQVAPQQLFYNV